jgi:hypothetical protein
VLHRNEDFEVVFGSRMRALTGGDNFFSECSWDGMDTCDIPVLQPTKRMLDVSGPFCPGSVI